MAWRAAKASRRAFSPSMEAAVIDPIRWSAGPTRCSRLYSRRSPDDIQIRGKRTTVPPPRELIPSLADHVEGEAPALDGLDGVVAGLVEAQVAAPIEVRDAALPVRHLAHDLDERDPANHLAAPSDDALWRRFRPAIPCSTINTYS